MQIDWSQFLDLANIVYEKINKNIIFQGIICPLNGGIYLSDFLSRRINLPIYCIDIKSYNEKNEQEDIKIQSFMPVIKPGYYLIADDIYDTGQTIKTIIDFYGFQNRFEFIVATLISNKYSINSSILWYGLFNQTKEWIKFPWEVY
jgi:hypoxanthine phosphoribosyltransferase